MANILLVDDDPEVVAGNAAVLESDGHTVAASSSADEAMSWLRRQMPDLVILEAMLGGKPSGIDLAESLSREYPDLPLIMLTDADEHLSSAELASQDVDGGWVPVDRYLAKPVLADVLADEVDHLLPNEQ